MKQDEIEKFSSLWKSARNISGNNKELEKNDYVMLFNMLLQFSLDDIKKALVIHGLNSKYAPTANDVASILVPNKTQNIGGEEAWSIGRKGYDGYDSVVSTDIIQTAANAAEDLWRMGDKVAARMVFLEVFAKEVAAAPGPPKWRLSPGIDKGLLEDAVVEAVRIGRLPESELAKYRIAPKTTTAKALIDESARREALALGHDGAAQPQVGWKTQNEKNLAHVKQLRVETNMPKKVEPIFKTQEEIEVERKRQLDIALAMLPTEERNKILNSKLNELGDDNAKID
jgi:hypothetical protein